MIIWKKPGQIDIKSIIQVGIAVVVFICAKFLWNTDAFIQLFNLTPDTVVWLTMIATYVIKKLKTDYTK